MEVWRFRLITVLSTAQLLQPVSCQQEWMGKLRQPWSPSPPPHFFFHFKLGFLYTFFNGFFSPTYCIFGFGLVKAKGNCLFTELEMKGMWYLQWSDLVSDLNSLQSAAATNVNKLTTLRFGVIGAEMMNLPKVQTQARTARCLTVWRDGAGHHLQHIQMLLGENGVFRF